MPDNNIVQINSVKSFFTGSKRRKIEYLPLFFLAVVFFFLPYGGQDSSLNTLAIVFVSIVLEAIPFMLVGSLVGGVIEAFVSRERMIAMLPKKDWLTVCIAAGAGIIFPVCECAVVPVVRRLTGKGLPFSAAIAYLLGGPVVNPLVAASTALAYAFDWRIVIMRLVFGYITAVTVGLIMGRLFAKGQALSGEINDHTHSDSSCGCHHHTHENHHAVHDCHEHHHGDCCDNQHSAGADTEPGDNASGCSCGCGHSESGGWLEKTGSALRHAMNDFLAVGQYLIIGAFIAALAQTYIDRSDYLSITAVPVLSVLLMMFLAVMLNLCSEADAFIAASFQGIMPVPAQMAFLLTGPMFDLKLLLMYQSVFTRKAIVWLASLIIAVVLLISIILVMFNGVLS